MSFFVSQALIKKDVYMNYLHSKYILYALFSLLSFIQCQAEGFSATTLVQTVSGYKQIQDLSIGEHVICHDTEKNYVKGTVSNIIKKSIPSYVRIHILDECICVANNQQFYDEKLSAWIIAGSLKNGDCLAGHAITIDFITETIDVYLITVAQYHHFFVSSANICTHNFIPVIVLSASVLFGGGLEMAGVTCGIAGLGTYLSYQWHKKNKQKHAIILQPQFYNNGMIPEDPEDEKKRKRDESREEYESLSNQQARNLAERMGFKLDKNPPFNSYGKLVFRKGNTYISADRTGHKGGVWKVFRRGEGRLGTWNVDLTTRIGD